MTKVKICGLQEVEHVKAAVAAGADAIGFVFANSKRKITVEKAKQLAKYVPQDVLKIGVFVNPDPAFVAEVAKAVPLDYVQYHGQETPEEIAKNNLPSIKALPVKSVKDVDKGATYHTDYLLFDAPGIEFEGGSGRTFDWQLLQNHGIEKEKLILAGGLNPDNVGEAVRRVQPYMVDVSSGVEMDGRKDLKLIKSFIEEVKKESVTDGQTISRT